MAKYANTYDSTYAPNPVTAKKKKPIPQTGVQGGAMPITGGPTQVVKGPAQGAPGGGAAGTLAPRPTGGTSVWDGGGVASPNPGGKDVYNWDESIRTPVGSGPRPPAGGGSAPTTGGGEQDNWAEDDLLGTSGTDYEDTRNLLYERIQQLMSEGATSTAELEEIIASQYGDVLDQGMGGILAQAGAGGMGLGGGMIGQSQDLARQVATDQSAAVIDARRQAEADLMDRLGVAGDLFGLGLEDMDREDFWAFMEEMNGLPGDEETPPGSGATGFHPAPDSGYTYTHKFEVPGNAEIIDENFTGDDGKEYTVWKDPATGVTYISPKANGGPGGYGFIPSQRGTDATIDSWTEWMENFE